VTSDQAFQSDPMAPTPRPWALSFYLCETQPRLYGAYLAKTAERPLFTDYPPAERMADFQSIFGSDIKMIEAKFLRYMEKK